MVTLTISGLAISAIIESRIAHAEDYCAIEELNWWARRIGFQRISSSYTLKECEPKDIETEYLKVDHLISIAVKHPNPERTKEYAHMLVDYFLMGGRTL